MKNFKISPRTAVTTITIVVTSISIFQWRALYALDHPPMHRTNCVTCHSDIKTLRAIADKAGDPLFLVKRGDLKELPLGCLCPDPVRHVISFNKSGVKTLSKVVLKAPAQTR